MTKNGNRVVGYWLLVIGLGLSGVLAGGPISRPSNVITGPGSSMVRINADGSIDIVTASGTPLKAYSSTARFDIGPLELGSIAAPSVSGAGDVRLYWDGAHIYKSANGDAYTIFGEGASIAPLVLGTNLVEQRNGTNSQNFYVYRSYTDASNYGRFYVRAGATGTNIDFGYESLGTVSGGDVSIFNIKSRASIRLVSGDTFSDVAIFQGGTSQWKVPGDNTGAFVPGADNTKDIGQSALRPRTIYVGTNINVNSTVTGSGTTGAQTINKARGTVRFGAGASALVVTDSLVASTSKLRAFPVGAFDVTATNFTCSAASGSFTITANAAATAETEVAFDLFIP